MRVLSARASMCGIATALAARPEARRMEERMVVALKELGFCDRLCRLKEFGSPLV